MFAPTEITAWHWSGFILCVLVFLALDLGVFHRRAHVVKFSEALAWTGVWFALSLLFAGALLPLRGQQEAMEFVTGYIIELSLSMDNVFVIALIFAYFQVPSKYQHRVLFWGILGALVMRGVMIALGAALIQRYNWMLYLFGAFLFFTGIRMLFADDENVRLKRYLIHIPSINQLDAGGSELITHRRIDIGVASRHAVPRRAREEREAAHEAAADAEDMDVHVKNSLADGVDFTGDNLEALLIKARILTRMRRPPRARRHPRLSGRHCALICSVAARRITTVTMPEDF